MFKSLSLYIITSQVSLVTALIEQDHFLYLSSFLDKYFSGYVFKFLLFFNLLTFYKRVLSLTGSLVRSESHLLCCDWLFGSNVTLALCCDWLFGSNVTLALCCDWLFGSNVTLALCCDWLFGSDVTLALCCDWLFTTDVTFMCTRSINSGSSLS